MNPEILTPEWYEMAYTELMTTLGTIQAFFLFIVLVIICCLVYKFFRMFF